jgi:hypothetical protein
VFTLISLFIFHEISSKLVQRKKSQHKHVMAHKGSQASGKRKSCFSQLKIYNEWSGMCVSFVSAGLVTFVLDSWTDGQGWVVQSSPVFVGQTEIFAEMKMQSFL